MVALTRENGLDQFPRNRSSAFQAIGTPSAKSFMSWVEWADELIDPYDWTDRPKPKVFRNILITPVAFGKNKELFNLIKDLKDEGVVENVMLDSGGFQVLTGSLESKGVSNLDDLQKLNEELYNEYDWADIYIMPDHPPNRADVYHGAFKEKVDNTIEASLKFFEVLKPEVQGKVAPVFHLQKDKDIEYMYQAYKPMLDKSKFASFSASALTLPGCPRQLRGEVLVMLNELQKYLKPKNVGLHCLGIASPPAVFILNHIGIRTFDASTPIIIAGLGNIFFPYCGGMPSSVQRDNKPDNLSVEKLERLRRETNHRCPFCEDIDQIKKETKGVEGTPGYMYRRMHNFCVLDELNWLYNDLDPTLLRKYSPSQYRDLMSITETEQISLF